MPARLSPLRCESRRMSRAGPTQKARAIAAYLALSDNVWILAKHQLLHDPLTLALEALLAPQNDPASGECGGTCASKPRPHHA